MWTMPGVCTKVQDIVVPPVMFNDGSIGCVDRSLSGCWSALELGLQPEFRGNLGFPATLTGVPQVTLFVQPKLT